MMCVDVASSIVQKLREQPMSCAILDDDPEYLSHLGKVLDDLGFLVFTFGDSQHFAEENKTCRFDIVIVSWDIQPLSGGMVVESIRQHGEPYPAIIVACDGGESVSLQLALSPVGFLFKPFDAKHLMEVLQKAIGG